MIPMIPIIPNLTQTSNTQTNMINRLTKTQTETTPDKGYKPYAFEPEDSLSPKPNEGTDQVRLE
jgi:hypothetical protein